MRGWEALAALLEKSRCCRPRGAADPDPFFCPAWRCRALDPSRAQTCSGLVPAASRALGSSWMGEKQRERCKLKSTKEHPRSTTARAAEPPGAGRAHPRVPSTSWGLRGAHPGGGTLLSSPTPLRIEGPQRHHGAVRSKSTPVTFGRGAASGRGHRDNVSMATKGLFNYSAAEARRESSLNSDLGNLFNELGFPSLRTSLASYEDKLCRGTADQMAVRGSIRPSPCLPGSAALLLPPCSPLDS